MGDDADGLVAADINGDGYPDIITGTPHKFAGRLGMQSGGNSVFNRRD